MKIALINESTVMTDDQLRPIATALEIQGQRDLNPIWRVTGPSESPITVVFVPKGQKPPPGCWWLVVMDVSDQAGALGYHELSDEGLPLGKAFVGTDLQYGASPSVTLSHEFCEMLVDPDCTSIKQVRQGRVALEVCDACEADKYGYEIDFDSVKVLVSDFVTPQFFQDMVPYEDFTRFDYCGHITAPMQILSEGYLSIDSGSGWTQVDGDKVPRHHLRAPVGSRRERRAFGQHRWARSIRP
jgi:hypothetical protein